MIESARSLLFVPGDRPDRFDKAAASPADMVIIDLEDAVASERKAFAREEAVSWLTTRHSALVRVNADESQLKQDLDAVGHLAHAIVLPKCCAPQDIERLQARVGRPLRVVALIETAAGVLASEHIARTPGVVRLALGNVDLAADLDVAPDDRTALQAARAALVLASAAAGLPGPIDGVTTDLLNVTRTRADARRARKMGMTAKLCIHPAQIAAVHDAMTPDDHTIAWARAVIATDTGGVTVHDGRMVDAPVVARAHRVLASRHV